MNCDASGMDIVDVLCRKTRPIAFLNETILDSKKNLYIQLEVLCHFAHEEHWRQYLLQKKFTLIIEHKVLKYINGQQNLSR